MRPVAMVALILTLLFASLSGSLGASARQDGDEESSPRKIFVIRTLDLDDTPVSGSCFVVTALEGPGWEQSICDEEPGDEGRALGWVTLDLPLTVTAVDRHRRFDRT